MKALVLEEYNRFKFRDFEKPSIYDDEVLIKVKAVGICGSDVHGMDGSTGRRIPSIVMGHEASGVIEELGSKVDGWEVGDRVTFDSTIYKLDDWFSKRGQYNLSDDRVVLGVSCGDYRKHGAFAEYVSVPKHILYRLPNEVTFKQAAMVEPAGVALHAVNLAKPAVGETAVVIGVGVIGLLTVQMLKVAGCSKIIAIDLEDEKLELAATFGATHTFNSKDSKLNEKLLELTEQRGADHAFEAVGIEPTVKLAIDSVRKGGSVTLLGNLSPTIEFPLQAVVTRQIKVQGSCAIAGEYEAVLQLMATKQLNVDALISATAPLSEGTEWFHRLYNKEKGLVKVILQP